MMGFHYLEEVKREIMPAQRRVLVCRPFVIDMSQEQQSLFDPVLEVHAPAADVVKCVFHRAKA